MKFAHKELAAGRWREFSFAEQMANIGSEVERAIKWRGKNADLSRSAFERGLELLWLTKGDPRNSQRLRELTRLYEVMVDYFHCENQYRSSDELWHKYFRPFNWAASARRGSGTARRSDDQVQPQRS